MRLFVLLLLVLCSIPVNGLAEQVEVNSVVIISDSFASRNSLPRGIWTVKAVGQDNSVVIKTRGGEEFVVEPNDYTPTTDTLGVKPNHRVILSDTYASKNELARGLWNVYAVGIDGSLVIQTANKDEYLVPVEYFTPTTDTLSVKPNQQIILDNSFASRNELDPGLWIVQAVGTDGSVVIRTFKNDEFIVKAKYYTPTTDALNVKTNQKIILDDSFASRNELKRGLWVVRAVGIDGSVVIRTPQNQEYIVPTHSYTELSDSLPVKSGQQVILSNAFASRNSLEKGLWNVVAVGTDGRIVVETVKGKQHVVGPRYYTLTQTCVASASKLK